MAALLVPKNVNGVEITSQTITTNTTTAGNGWAVPQNTKEILLYTECTARTDGMFTPQIDGSIDGINWINLKQGLNIITVTKKLTSWVVEVDGALPPFVRISILSTLVTSGATLNAKVFIK